MALTVLASVRKEVELILAGIKRPRNPSKRAAKGLISNAKENLGLLNEIASKQPITTFLERRGVIAVLENFSRNNSEKVMNSSLTLAKVKGIAGLYFFKNCEFPVNRTDDDCILVTQEEIDSWSKESFRQFAELTEKQIWDNILVWLKEWRRNVRR